MKNTVIILSIITTGILVSACEKSKDFVAENSTPTGVGSRPVSSNPLRITGTATALDAAKIAAGNTVTTELQFFSESPVKEINLYSTISAGTRTKVSTYPYQAAFSAFKGADTLLVPYTVPAGLSSNTSIKLEYEILNVNALNLVRSATIKVL